MLPFFVYGTLLRDEANHHLLKKATLSCQEATFSGGVMYDLGQYPMVVRGEGLIVGELVEILPEMYDPTLKRLDILEGVSSANREDPTALYQRLRVTVQTSARGAVEAWIYFGQERLASQGRLIPGGDWKRRFEKPEQSRTNNIQE